MFSAVCCMLQGEDDQLGTEDEPGEYAARPRR